MTSQVAITLLKSLEQSLYSYCELNDEGKTAFSMAISALELFGNSEQLPSTHSKLEKNSQKLDNENGELISRQEVIAEFSCCELTPDGGIDANYAIDFLEQLPSVQPDNQTNLCDSCDYSYPECPSKNDDVIFGNGIGNDNICACNKYKPSTQPVRKKGEVDKNKNIDA